MQEQPSQIERLRTWVWEYLEAGEWHMAMVAAQRLSDLDRSSAESQALAESACTLSGIADAIVQNGSIDQYALVRLQEVARAWPRLATAPQFQALLRDAGRAASAGGATSIAPSAAAAAPDSAPLRPARRAPKRSHRPHMPHPRGWAGIAATLAVALVVLLVFNSGAYYYLREQPTSKSGWDAKAGAYATLAPWHGLMDLEGPVDTIVLGDSCADWDMVTGPIADRLGGTCINLGNNGGSSLLMDSWMLQYYIDRFGPPHNVIVLRSCSSYEGQHRLEFLSLVPLEWGYWDRLGPAPDWHKDELRRLFLSKYAVLDSRSDVLSDRLTHPLDLFSQPHQKVEPDPGYSNGVPSDIASTLQNFTRKNLPSFYTPFVPSVDSANAVEVMSDRARSLGFQLYIAIGPEWDEAYQDPDRQGKVAGMEEWLYQFTDSEYVHLVLTTPMLFRADQLHNPNHLRPGSEKQYTEAMVQDIVTIQNSLVGTEARPVEVTSAVPDKSQYALEERPSVTLTLAAGENVDVSTPLEGDVSCLLRPAGKSDMIWLYRAPASPFSIGGDGSTEATLSLSEGRTIKAGTYDLIVFVRQDAGSLSYETRIELPQMITFK